MKQPDFQIRPSRYLASFLLLIHGGAILVVLLLDTLWWAKLLATLPILISFFMLFRKHVALRAKHAVLKIRLIEQGRWELTTRSQETVKAFLHPDSLVTDKLLVLNFKSENKKRSFNVILCNDSIDKASFRQMKIRLGRW